MTPVSAARTGPRPPAGVSSCVAPVARAGVDPVRREDLARLEGDDRDLLLVDDRQDAPPGMGRTDLEVVQPPGPSEGHGTPAIGGVVAQSEVAPPGGTGRLGLGECPVRL